MTTLHHWRESVARRDRFAALGATAPTYLPDLPAHESFAAHPCSVETDQTEMGAPTGLEALLAIGQGRNVSRSFEARS